VGQSQENSSVFYDVGDASGPVFKVTLRQAGSTNIMLHYGQWIASVTEEESSSVLDKSMDAGRYADQVQWATFRKPRYTLANLGQAGIGGLGDAIGAFNKNQTWATQGDTHKSFFVRFITGIHRRVGKEVRRDEPVTIGVLKEIPRLFWRSSGFLRAGGRSPL
jgi:hypothetical protein